MFFVILILIMFLLQMGGGKPENYFDLYSKLMSNFNSEFYDIYEDFYDSPLAHLEAFFDIIRDAISEFDF